MVQIFPYHTFIIIYLISNLLMGVYYVIYKKKSPNEDPCTYKIYFSEE